MKNLRKIYHELFVYSSDRFDLGEETSFKYINDSYSQHIFGKVFWRVGDKTSAGKLISSELVGKDIVETVIHYYSLEELYGVEAKNAKYRLGIYSFTPLDSGILVTGPNTLN